MTACLPDETWFCPGQSIMLVLITPDTLSKALPVKSFTGFDYRIGALISPSPVCEATLRRRRGGTRLPSEFRQLPRAYLPEFRSDRSLPCHPYRKPSSFWPVVPFPASRCRHT